MINLLRRSYRTGLSVVLVGVVSFVGSAAVGLLQGIPEPAVQDEFSYLLAAETFSQGRLTNPTHPMWVHFESFHIIHQPTYMSKYQPAQGLVLALGKVIGGHPIVGAWLSMALMSAATCWMLHAWLPSRWALLGGLLTIIQPYIGVGGYWAQSYWGGAIAATGGALLLGGARYLMREPRVIYAVAVAMGLAIMANSRPYEGLVISLPVGFGLLAWLMGKRRPALGVMLRRVLLPIVVGSVVTMGSMAFYNYRITDNVLHLPYLIHEQTYSMSALFLWEKPPPKPTYHHKFMENYANASLPLYIEKRSVGGFIKVNFAAFMMYMLFAGSVFAIPLIGSAQEILFWCWNDRWGRFALLTYAFFVLGMTIETYMSLHYWAPIIALNYLFIMQGFRLWRARDPRIGRLVLYAVPFLALAILGINTYYSVKARHELAPHLQRARLLDQLNQGKDRHLIVVQYGPNHSYDREWVYNEADIDASKVVWARDMDTLKNCELINYFKDRVVWFLEIDRDEEPVKLTLYPKQSCLLAHSGT